MKVDHRSESTSTLDDEAELPSGMILEQDPARVRILIGPLPSWRKIPMRWLAVSVVTGLMIVATVVHAIRERSVADAVGAALGVGFIGVIFLLNSLGCVDLLLRQIVLTSTSGAWLFITTRRYSNPGHTGGRTVFLKSLLAQRMTRSLFNHEVEFR
jgi:hypothetical protein